MDWHLLGNGVVTLECVLILAWLSRIGVKELRKLPVPVLIAFLSLASGTSIVAQKTNWVNNLPPMPMPPRSAPVVETVTEGDIARGWRVESVATNETVSYTMPSNASYVGNWHVHGARSSFGNNVFDFGAAGTPRPTSWSFPLGTNGAAFSSFWYFVDGRIRPTPKDAAHEICAVGVPMSAVPGQSRLWAVAEADDSRVLTWENFFLGGDTNAPVSAQIRLFANGDFTTRSNDVETVCRRVNPDDWDGDGLANEKDVNPLAYDGDFFGVPNALPTNANLDAYYTLDVAADGALDFATIRVTCDGPSDLGDHVVIARTSQVCHVPLLAGAMYAVESTLPLAYSAVSSEHAHIVTNSQNSRVVSFPLEFSFEPMRAVASFRLVSNPVDVNATLLSVVGGCCSCQTNDVGFTWSCDGGCPCGGGVGHMLSSTVAWQGYSSLFTGWHVCPCPPVVIPEGGQGDSSPKLVIDSPRTFFTNSNGGAEDSDVVMVSTGLWAPVDTNGTVTLRLRQGNVVNVWSTSNRHQRVGLPLTWDVAEMRQRTVYIEGARETARGGEALELEWRDESGGLLLATNLDLAVYHPILDVVNSSVSVGGRLCNPSGIVTGTNAWFYIGYKEVPIPEDEVVWSIVEGNAGFEGSNTGLAVRVTSDVPDQRVKLRAQIDDCRSRPPEISACVVDPQYVKLTVWIVGNRDGSYYPIDVATVSNMVADVNRTYEQIGVCFYIDSITHTNSDFFLDLAQGSGQDLAKRRELVNLTKNSFGLEVYFIKRIGGNIKANNDEYGIVVSTNWTSDTLAHEIGHSFGCADVYPTHWDNARISLPDNVVRREHASLDWNNGDGSRYYSPNLTQMKLIERVLMCGYNVGLDRRDMPSGPIYGFNKTNECDNVDTGFFVDGTRRSLFLHR